MLKPPIILFTHIPKTGGTSIKESLIRNTSLRTLKFKGIKDFAFKNINGFDFLEGHYPYGIHHFIRRRKSYYFVILREPLDQAISYYYFIRQCDQECYQHPNLKDAKKYSIAEFYKNEKYQNIQTKFIAGFPCNSFSAILPGDIRSKILLQYAKKNLESNYNFFGFLENIDSCQDILSQELDLPNLRIKDNSKVTRNRPRQEELDSSSKKIITEANEADFKLYNFAKKIFRNRYLIHVN